jgi:acyl-CoA synthetase (AMP-forming)/AMP-acid ligase II
MEAEVMGRRWMPSEVTDSEIGRSRPRQAAGPVLAGYKAPDRWPITDAFSLTPSGRIRKDALREQLAARSPA